MSEPRVMMNFMTAAAVAAVTIIVELVKARDRTTQAGNWPMRSSPPINPFSKPSRRASKAKRRARRTPTLKVPCAFAAWVIARLGGWTGYYGKPGPQVIRRGLDYFRRIKFGATLSLKDV